MLNLVLDSENLSTKPSSPNHSIPGEAPPHFQDFLEPINNAQFEIDVKPKKKVFFNDEEKKKYVEDYKKKLKTELCKTFMMTGKCRYGSKCSFAHGKSELKEKSHLNVNYKTRPCKQYFLVGYCPYGYRCQYLHTETKFVEEFRSFLVSAYKQNGLRYEYLENLQTEQQKLHRLEDMYSSMRKNEEIMTLLNVESQEHKAKRLQVFKEFSI
jgi:butyrate response factor 1